MRESLTKIKQHRDAPFVAGTVFGMLLLVISSLFENGRPYLAQSIQIVAGVILVLFAAFWVYRAYKRPAQNDEEYKNRRIELALGGMLLLAWVAGLQWVIRETIRTGGDADILEFASLMRSIIASMIGVSIAQYIKKDKTSHE